MSTSLVLSVIGQDRPGLVESLSQTLSAHEASWQESRMSRLTGRVAGILRVSVPAARAEHPGIIHQVAEALAVLDINVDELETSCERAPMCGGLLFKASARLSVPNDPQSPFVTSGVRIGTATVTTRGFRETEVITVADWICDILDEPDNELVVTRVKQQVLALCADYPVYTGAASNEARVA